MSRIVLLGAGASVDAEIPTAVGMTEKIMKHFEDRRVREELKALKFVIGGLLFRAGIQGRNPLSGVNVEEVFTATRALADRDDLEISPFVGQWHPFINELERNRADIRNAFRGLKAITDKWTMEQFISALEKELSKITDSSKGGIFERTNLHMLRLLCRFVWIKEESKIAHLLPLVNFAVTERLTIATLNYDNTIELAAKFAGVGVDTGFQRWLETGHFGETDSDIELLKIHGSIDWRRRKRHISDPSFFHDAPLEMATEDEIEKFINSPVGTVGYMRYEPEIIFGTGNKLTAKGPFLDLFRAFKHRLEKR